MQGIAVTSQPLGGQNVTLEPERMTKKGVEGG